MALAKIGASYGNLDPIKDSYIATRLTRVIRGFHLFSWSSLLSPGLMYSFLFSNAHSGSLLDARRKKTFSKDMAYF